eukprot:scaffold187973_cov19-Tisochrysis_lutea.AAC.1
MEPKAPFVALGLHRIPFQVYGKHEDVELKCVYGMHENANLECATGSIQTCVYGKHEDVDLKPNGRNIHVTPENAVEYIHRIADFRLNKELRGPCNAFLSGFFMMEDAQCNTELMGQGIAFLSGFFIMLHIRLCLHASAETDIMC